MGDVAVVLLARRQGEVAVGVELEMRGKHDRARPTCVPAVTAALQWQQRLYTSHHMRSCFCLVIHLIFASGSNRHVEYLSYLTTKKKKRKENTADLEQVAFESPLRNCYH